MRWMRTEDVFVASCGAFWGLSLAFWCLLGLLAERVAFSRAVFGDDFRKGAWVVFGLLRMVGCLLVQQLPCGLTSSIVLQALFGLQRSVGFLCWLPNRWHCLYPLVWFCKTLLAAWYKQWSNLCCSTCCCSCIDGLAHEVLIGPLDTEHDVGTSSSKILYLPYWVI